MRLEQALWARQPERDSSLIHHSDRGSQYVSIRYSERLAEAGIEPSVGSKGDSYDNALAETINGLYKAELIHRRAPWKTKEAVELATLEWVSWFNHHRLLEPIGYIPPAEAEANYYRQLANQASHWRPDLNQTASTKPGAIHGIGKRRLERREAEVVIRIALADVNRREVFATGLDCIDQGFAVGKRKAAIDQDRIARASYQYRGAKESMLACAKMFPGQNGICSHGVFHSQLGRRDSRGS